MLKSDWRAATGCLSPAVVPGRRGALGDGSTGACGPVLVFVSSCSASPLLLRRGGASGFGWRSLTADWDPVAELWRAAVRLARSCPPARDAHRCRSASAPHLPGGAGPVWIRPPVASWSSCSPRSRASSTGSGGSSCWPRCSGAGQPGLARGLGFCAVPGDAYGVGMLRGHHPGHHGRAVHRGVSREVLLAVPTQQRRRPWHSARPLGDDAARGPPYARSGLLARSCWPRPRARRDMA